VLDVIQDRLEGLRASGLSILLAEQNVDLALDIAERVVILDDTGRCAWRGTAAELHKDPGPLEQFLGI